MEYSNASVQSNTGKFAVSFRLDANTTWNENIGFVNENLLNGATDAAVVASDLLTFAFNASELLQGSVADVKVTYEVNLILEE